MSDKMLMRIWAWAFTKLAKRGYFAWIEASGSWMRPDKVSICKEEPRPLALEVRQEIAR